MQEKVGREGQSHDTIVEHEIPCVTVDMLDWWWDNMEKAYPLYHPTAHKSFVWEVPPGKVGHVGAINNMYEIVDEEVVVKGRSRREDVNVVPASIIIYGHVEVNAAIDADNKNAGQYIVHQYEATSYGTRMRSTFHSPEPVPPRTDRHSEEETALFAHFLPELYKLWQVVTDREINPHFCLKVKRLPNGQWTYVEKVKLYSK